jgi:N-acetylglucosaminyl-diphospho-decaprenol L-rhamnosyltransferase
MDEEKKMKPLVSIVIIEFYSLEEIKKCVTAAQNACKDLEYEIIISSNSCYDKNGKKEALNRIPFVRWLFNEENKGFAYGMNIGMKHATGDFVIISNPDSRILAGLREAIDFMTKNPWIGAIGPKIINDKGEIQDSCRKDLYPSRFIIRNIKRLLLNKSNNPDYPQHLNKLFPVDWIVGGFILIRYDVSLVSH